MLLEYECESVKMQADFIQFFFFLSLMMKGGVEIDEFSGNLGWMMKPIKEGMKINDFSYNLVERIYRVNEVQVKGPKRNIN